MIRTTRGLGTGVPNTGGESYNVMEMVTSSVIGKDQDAEAMTRAKAIRADFIALLDKKLPKITKNIVAGMERASSGIPPPDPTKYWTAAAETVEWARAGKVIAEKLTILSSGIVADKYAKPSSKGVKNAKGDAAQSWAEADAGE